MSAYIRRLGGASEEIRDCFASVRRPRQTKLAGSGFSRALVGAVTVKRKEESHD